MNLGVWSGRRVLVTGAGGFIGGHLVERLAGLGARVRAGSRDHTVGRGDWRILAESELAGIQPCTCDIGSPEQLKSSMDGVETVFHLAAKISAADSYSDPAVFIATNVIGTLNVLVACREAGVSRLIHVSSADVYGTPRYAPIDESHPLQARSPYAATKIAAEKLVESYQHSFGLPGVVIRPFNTFGPRQSARAVIPNIVRQALWADRIELGAIEPRRDFSYVSDIVNGILAIGLADGVEGEVFNFGTGYGVSIAEVVDMVREIVGREVPIVSKDHLYRPGSRDIDNVGANAEKARARLGWAPAIPLVEGLRQTIGWMRRDPTAMLAGAARGN